MVLFTRWLSHNGWKIQGAHIVERMGNADQRHDVRWKIEMYVVCSECSETTILQGLQPRAIGFNFTLFHACLIFCTIPTLVYSFTSGVYCDLWLRRRWLRRRTTGNANDQDQGQLPRASSRIPRKQCCYWPGYLPFRSIGVNSEFKRPQMTQGQ